jgi:hypothetical protein
MLTRDVFLYTSVPENKERRMVGLKGTILQLLTVAKDLCSPLAANIRNRETTIPPMEAHYTPLEYMCNKD